MTQAAKHAEELAKAYMEENHVNSTEAEKADEALRALILPKPVDPLVEAMRNANLWTSDGAIGRLRAELAKLGLTIAPIGEQP